MTTLLRLSDLFRAPRGRWRNLLVLGPLIPLVALPVSSVGARERDDAAERDATKGDITRLERELKEQRALLEKVARSEQEHYEAVRRLLDRPGVGKSGSPGAATTPATGEGSDSADAAAVAAPRPVPPPLTFTRVSGRVITKGVALKDVYVYLEGFRSLAGRSSSLEIVQAGKQFEPRFAVALLGTKVSFPNRDAFFHNVFSSAPAPFDLGTYRANEASPGVVLKTPGVVEIFCNIHAQMSAQVLVVPNRVFVKVSDDGSFRLDKVPAGRRKLVAWGPGLKPQRLDVNVAPNGSEVSFELEPELAVRHKNKFGQPYGSYKE